MFLIPHLAPNVMIDLTIPSYAILNAKIVREYIALIPIMSITAA